jgi:internalin A
MINKIKSNSREIITMLILLFFISCDKPKNNAEEKIFRYVKSYQYHEKDVTDFSFLSKYKNLEILDLTGTSVEDLSFLKHITKLKFLILIDTKVKSLDSIKHLENLEELHLKGTNVKDLSPLKKLKKLNIDGQFAKTIIDNSLSFQNIDIESLRIHDYECFF